MNLPALQGTLNQLDVAFGLRGRRDAVLFGSTVMAMHGLRDHVSDVDVFVGQGLYAQLRRSGPWVEREPNVGDPPLLELTYTGLTVHAFKAWQRRDPHVDVDAAFRYGEWLHGWRCCPLWLIRLHKAGALAWQWPYAGREKHVTDIAAIDAALAAPLAA